MSDYILKPFRAPVHLQIDYEKELNEQQRAAVTANPGPSLVIAGAGSGKTRTLIYRVAFLLEQGIPPERILLLTFTNKAAREMMTRVSGLLGNHLLNLWGGTFHSIGNRILRRHAPLVRYRPDFSIMDREDADKLLAACMEELKIDSKKGNFPKPDVVADIFSLAVNKEQSIAAIVKKQFDYFSGLTPKLQELREHYVKRKLSTNAMDFDDLLSLWLKLLRDNVEVCEEYQRRFQFILVDEYQDTNKIQGDIIDILAAKHQNVMAVGDDSQSIYAWRGANFQNIFEFQKRYPKAVLYKVQTNYRSTPEILTLANAVIARNERQLSKELVAARPSGMKPVMAVCPDARSQAAFVAQRVGELHEQGVPLRQMAVLYRSHFHALELQMELTQRNIPFSITSGISFFAQAHVKDVVAYIKLTVNPRDELSFKRIALMLPGVGKKSADKLWGAVASSAPEKSLVDALRRAASVVPKKAVADWNTLIDTLSSMESEPVRNDVSQMIKTVLGCGYRKYMQENFTNFSVREEDLEQLAAFAMECASVEEFLTQIALQTSTDTEASDSQDKDELRLSTIHQAKGLEFDVVFVIMLCEGLFPSFRSTETDEGVEEERRLFYVAATRARNELYLSYPQMRFSFNSGNAYQLPSRFLDELPDGLTDEFNVRTF